MFNLYSTENLFYPLIRLESLLIRWQTFKNRTLKLDFLIPRTHFVSSNPTLHWPFPISGSCGASSISRTSANSPKNIKTCTVKLPKVSWQIRRAREEGHCPFRSLPGHYSPTTYHAGCDALRRLSHPGEFNFSVSMEQQCKILITLCFKFDQQTNR